MENIFNPETRENWKNAFENKTSAVSPNKILCAAAGSFLLGATLKIAGQKKIGSFVGSWALPLLALGAYRKFSGSSSSENKGETQNDQNYDQKQTQNTYQSNDLNYDQSNDLNKQSENI